MTPERARHRLVVAAVIVVLAAVALGVPSSGASEPSERVPRTWYVATDGADDAAGTSARPFATWQRGIDAARPGDTVLVRGGTYPVSGDRYAGVTIDRSGSRARPITLTAEDPADRPVLDCGGLTNAGSLTCLYLVADWWRVRHVEVTGTPQPTPDTPSALLLYGASHNRLRDVASHHNRGTGIRIGGDSRHNLLRDCDAYANQDPGTTSDPYGNADGIAVAFLPRRAVGNRVVDCRSWSNSDDGFDLWRAEAPVSITGSWAFRNGYVPGTSEPAGNGQGFKLGRNATGPRHVVRRSLGFANRTYGFDENGATGPMRLVNNTAFRNGEGGFALYGGLRHVVRNNVALPGRGPVDPAVDDRWNSWTLRVDATSDDFRSIDWSRAAGPRRPGGGLPVLRLLRLRAGSDLVDAGTDVGLPYAGAAPDLGAYERRS